MFFVEVGQGIYLGFKNEICFKFYRFKELRSKKIYGLKYFHTEGMFRNLWELFLTLLFTLKNLEFKNSICYCLDSEFGLKLR